MNDIRTRERRATVNWDAVRRAFGRERVDEYLRTRDPNKWDTAPESESEVSEREHAHGGAALAGSQAIPRDIDAPG